MTDKQLKAVAMPGDFIFHSSWFEIFKSFDMATAYAIFIAMISYVQTGEIPADEELRRLTVFLFAHIDTDRERLLSLQPKRRTSTKKKTNAKVPEPESTEPVPDTTPSSGEDSEPTSNTSETFTTAVTSAPPAPPAPSLISETSETSETSDTSISSDTSASVCIRQVTPTSRHARFEKSVTRMVNEARKRKYITGQIKRKKRR